MWLLAASLLHSGGELGVWVTPGLLRIYSWQGLGNLGDAEYRVRGQPHTRQAPHCTVSLVPASPRASIMAKALPRMSDELETSTENHTFSYFTSSWSDSSTCSS